MQDLIYSQVNLFYCGSLNNYEYCEVPVIATVSDTSDRPQHDIGNYLVRLHSAMKPNNSTPDSV